MQETVIVYAMLPVFPGPLPTLKAPYTTTPYTCAMACVTTFATGPVIWQLVPSGVPAIALNVRNIQSPYTPVAEDIVAKVRVPACASLGGVATE